MAKSDILVIGAGASGLMVAHQLTAAGYKVMVLEARNRIGGRIHTITNSHGKTELGAEFIHGDLPVTLALLKEAGIGYHAAGGEMWHFKDGELDDSGQNIDGWDEVIHKMQELKEDISLTAFLNSHFDGVKNDELRRQVERYVSGYDTADPGNASVFALREEWLNEDEGAQHRLDNGYCQMIDYLANSIKSGGNTVKLDTPVTRLEWSDGQVTAYSVAGEAFEASKAVVALPLGVLKSDGRTAIAFQPLIMAQQNALQQIGFGAIIKVLLRFKTKFWERSYGKDLSDALFFMSAEQIPTWWTQAPRHEFLLTGWLGGNPARQYVKASDEDLLNISLESLSAIFNTSIDQLRDDLIEWNIANWTADPYTLGSYAYDMVGSVAARQLLNQAVHNTIYFAGEYLYDGPAMGTVEAALTSAQRVAKRIIG